MPKVLILAGDAAESLEVMYPYQRLLEEGYEVDMAGPSKKKLQFVVHDFVDEFDTYTEKLGYTWPADVAFADVDPAEYVALVIPGGRAPEYIRNDPDFKRIVQHFFGEEKPVAQLCHAPLALAAAGVLGGRGTAGGPGPGPHRGGPRCRVRGLGGRGRRRDGLGPRLAGPPGVDARVRPRARGAGARGQGGARGRGRRSDGGPRGVARPRRRAPAQFQVGGAAPVPVELGHLV